MGQIGLTGKRTRMRHDVRVLAALSGVWVCMWMVAQAEPSAQQIERWVRDLRSGGETSRREAAASLAETGPLAAETLAAEVENGPARFRRDAIAVLRQIECGDADWALADRAVNDRDGKVKALALSALREGRGDAAKERLLELVQDDSPKTRQRAAAVVRKVGDATVVDELIDRLDRALPLNDKAMLAIRAEDTKFKRYEDFGVTYRVGTSRGVRSVRQKQLMPVIGATSVETKVVVGLRRGLADVTGVDFRNDLTQWRSWWKVNRDAFGGSRKQEQR